MLGSPSISYHGAYLSVHLFGIEFGDIYACGKVKYSHVKLFGFEDEENILAAFLLTQTLIYYLEKPRVYHGEWSPLGGPKAQNPR